MKFTIDVKELKKLMDKGITVINKKCAVPALTRLYFQVEENGVPVNPAKYLKGEGHERE